MTAKRTILVVTAIALAAAIALRPGTGAARWARRAVRRGRSKARHVTDRLRGVAHRSWRGDRTVDDQVLADRVRSTLGRVTRDLDLPHVHVMVEDGVVVLHGDVASEEDSEVLEQRACDVPGVRGVESYLHVGLQRSDTRPSAGRAVHPPSDARQRRPGRDDDFNVRTLDELVATVSDVDPALGATRSRLVTDAVLGELSQLIPEERDDVAAILPAELRRLWQRSREQASRR